MNLANEGRRDHPGNYLRLFFNNYVERGVFIGDLIEINTIYSNTEAIKDVYITLRNNVTQKEYGTLITENFATSTLFLVPANLPQDEWYDLILRLRDNDDIVLYENVTWLGPIFVKAKSE